MIVLLAIFVLVLLGLSYDPCLRCQLWVFFDENIFVYLFPKAIGIVRLLTSSEQNQ